MRKSCQKSRPRLDDIRVRVYNVWCVLEGLNCALRKVCGLAMNDFGSAGKIQFMEEAEDSWHCFLRARCPTISVQPTPLFSLTITYRRPCTVHVLTRLNNMVPGRTRRTAA